MKKKELDLLLLPELREILDTKDYKELQEFCESAHPAVIAELISGLTCEELWTVLRNITPALRVEIFSHLDESLQVEIARALRRDELAGLLADMSHDDRADLFKKIPKSLREAVLPAMAMAEREDIRKLAAYQEGTAGAVMTSDYAALSPELTAYQAIERLRQVAPDKETIYYAYVLDRDRKLLGFVSLKDLILAKRDDRVEDIMHGEVISVRVEDDREEVAHKIQKYDLLALPVVNSEGALVGIVTYDDIQDIIEEEATEDFHRFGGLTYKTDGLDLNIREAGFLTMLKKRLPWLLALVFVNIFSGAGIAYYEKTIAAAVSLVFFLPLLIGSGGNAGSQTATLVVRAMAVGDIRMSDWLRLLGREVAVALGIGAVMGAAVYAIGIFRSGPEVAVVVAMAMVVNVLFGSLVGMSLPFLLIRLKLDPAAASAPLIASIADIAGVLIYFGLATWYLKDVIAAA
jgi:magnesium transporter